VNAAYKVVESFEREVATYAGAPYAVAVDSCTNALFLACKYLGVEDVWIPARTYLSVPMSILHAGGRVHFEDREWRGAYQLKPYPIWDGAKRFRSGMYQGGLHCLSFHANKIIAIGKGGMVLTDDIDAVDWLKQARYEGRHQRPYDEDRVDMLGWNMYMTPEQAARGLTLMASHLLDTDPPDQEEVYPDLRDHPVFQPFATPHGTPAPAGSETSV